MNFDQYTNLNLEIEILENRRKVEEEKKKQEQKEGE